MMRLAIALLLALSADALVLSPTRALALSPARALALSRINMCAEGPTVASNPDVSRAMIKDGFKEMKTGMDGIVRSRQDPSVHIDRRIRIVIGRTTVNTSRKATGGLPEHETHFERYILRYEPPKQFPMPSNHVIKRTEEHRICGFPKLGCF